MGEIDLSIKDGYYSQINNKYFSLEACMPTSFIMALIYNKILVVEAGSPAMNRPFFVYPKGMQPEDFLGTVCRSPWGYDLRSRLAQWAEKDDIPPNQIHAVISEVVNRMVGSNVTKFETNKRIEDVINELRAGHSLVITGKFTQAGHAVVVCGMRTDDKGAVTDFLIDDPYGDYYSNYDNKNGNNTWFPVADFERLWMRWYHRFNALGVV
jgi:hypothetical protein